MTIAELEYDHNVHQNRHSQDHKLYVRFFTAVMPDEERTKVEGRKCFRDAEMIQIMTPGNKNQIIIREVRDFERQRFGALYEKWVANKKEDVLEGYPLSEWTQMTPSLVEELRYFGFRTVEHVANANETAIQKMAGLRDLTLKAKAWLEMRATQAPLERAQADKEAMQAQIDGLQSQIKDLIEALRAEKEEKAAKKK